MRCQITFAAAGGGVESSCVGALSDALLSSAKYAGSRRASHLKKRVVHTECTQYIAAYSRGKMRTRRSKAGSLENDRVETVMAIVELDTPVIIPTVRHSRKGSSAVDKRALVGYR